MNGNGPPVRGERLYRWLLRLYPRAFRERYADDMVAFYRERLITDSSAGVRLAPVWARLLPDLIASACAERFATHFATHFAPSLERRRMSALAPQMPLHRPEDSMSILQQDIRFALRG